MAAAASRALLLAPLVGAALLRGDPLSVPDGPYDPNDLLCRRGKETKLGWCVQWLSCVKQKAEPQGTPEAVIKAWAPADCKEYCGKWPVTSGFEGGNHTSNNRTGAALLSLSSRSRGDCEKSCENFQGSLSSCVATILFEPGKVVNMGMPDGKAKKSVPEICISRNTSCLPDLPLEHQRCVSHKASKVLGSKVPAEVDAKCEKVKLDMDFCKDCPQLHEDYTSHYHSFVGGCMDQLNAYHAATHPDAGYAAIPGATGCTVHT